MAYEQRDFDKLFEKSQLLNLKCRLLEERRWKEFTDDVCRITDQGVSLEEAIDLLKPQYRPMAPERVPPPPRAPAAPPKEREREKKAPLRKIIGWVFENVANMEAVPEDAPTAGAWGLLTWVRASPANQSEFYKGIWPRILPTKAQLEEIAGKEEVTDEGTITDIENLLADALAEIVEEDRSLSAGPEGVRGEPPLAGEDPAGGGPGPANPAGADGGLPPGPGLLDQHVRLHV